MSDPFCPQHHPRKYSQCGCPLPKPPAKPLLADVCRWCLTGTYAHPFCRQFGHWRMIMEEYERDIMRFEQTYGKPTEPKHQESALPVVTATEPRVTRPAVLLILPPSVREYLASLGQRGGSSRSERKQAASRMNGKRGGRPRRILFT